MNINRYIIALAAAATSLAACDNIAQDDRYIAVEKPALPTEAVAKTLLIQEFTGANCRNCPKGAAVINSIKAANPGRVISVGMHPEGGGQNTIPIGTQNFRCDEAQVMYTYYHPGGFPCAVFNGTESSTDYDGSWNTLAIAALEEQAYIEIDAVTAYDDATRHAEVAYTLDFTGVFDTELSIMAWLIEDNIIGTQNDAGRYILDYVHNHVLRASLNGDWGETLGAEFKTGQSITGSASITLDDSWVAENCRILLYVFRNADKAVEQAAIFDVIATNP